eukprot:UN08181
MEIGCPSTILSISFLTANFLSISVFVERTIYFSYF